MHARVWDALRSHSKLRRGVETSDTVRKRNKEAGATPSLTIQAPLCSTASRCHGDLFDMSRPHIPHENEARAPPLTLGRAITGYHRHRTLFSPSPFLWGSLRNCPQTSPAHVGSHGDDRPLSEPTWRLERSMPPLSVPPSLTRQLPKVPGWQVGRRARPRKAGCLASCRRGRGRGFSDWARGTTGGPEQECCRCRS